MYLYPPKPNSGYRSTLSYSSWLLSHQATISIKRGIYMVLRSSLMCILGRHPGKRCFPGQSMSLLTIFGPKLDCSSTDLSDMSYICLGNTR